MTKQERRAERDELRETVERLREENAALRARNETLTAMVRAAIGPEPVLLPSVWGIDPADGWPPDTSYTKGMHTVEAGGGD